MRGSLWHGNAMANGDGIVPYLNVFDDEAYDSLALGDTQRISSTAQAGKNAVRVFARRRKAARSLAWSAIACNSARTACSRWRSAGVAHVTVRSKEVLPGRRTEVVRCPCRRALILFAGSAHAFGSDRTSALLPAGGQVPVGSGLGPPAVGSPRPRRSDRADPAGSGGGCRRQGHPVFASCRSQYICSNEFCVRWCASMSRKSIATLPTADQPLHDTRLYGATARS